ncbi:hypothetical protein [Viridibacillus soli]|uniref:hypothetical protein n=1 Tax=Viridibacillus soli TaxID=2798301 RepID=UPI001F28EF82|nr:hypothetical protein [Viridibacillus soli]
MGKKVKMILGMLFLIAGLILIFYQTLMGLVISKMSKATIGQQDIEVAMQNPNATFDFEQVADLNVKDVVKAISIKKK